MKLYNVRVQIEHIIVVCAKDKDDAIEVAIDHWESSLSDSSTEPNIQVSGEIKTVIDLKDDWDDECLPYGGDGNTRIRDLL